ncbi:sugar transferase [Nocardioides pinisoli]|uniref:Sugar transferase n=1 Tax=Nocardioides pinisoli TaxID=2950279 RepID=A0ABT1KT38_9ACTN|nr:sugar transferase [Nocardioides pinisoli]MCP3420915.1 sugar transferase [Nocardioides pinisoli]
MSRAPEAALPRPKVLHRSIQATVHEADGAVEWRRRHARALLLGDLFVLALALGTAQVIRFGSAAAPEVDGLGVTYPALGLVLAVVWWASLQIHQSRSPLIVGHGPDEYRRVIVATFRVFAVMAMISLAFQIDASRLYLATAFPLGLAGLLVERKLARVGLHRARTRGAATTKVLVVGGARSAAQLTRWFDKHPTAGYAVGGVWVPDARTPIASLDGFVGHIPVMSASLDFAEALTVSGAGAVVVTDTEHLGHESLRDLTWQLEGTGVELMISPNVLDVSSARLHLNDVSGMPMLHLREPQYAGADRFLKRAFDFVGAATILFILAPVLLVTALAIKLDSRGPVFYRQERVGRHRAIFKMTKFRSMAVDAEQRLDGLRALNESDAVLFKIRHDPRVTRVGRFIRRYSIDELPQLLDVLRGEMSLVGPRPSLAAEVEQYSVQMGRRMYVRPGMTGLWQVSGRSDLSFDEAERLDLAYVDNWSITGDLMIMLRTVRAVTRGQGAY